MSAIADIMSKPMLLYRSFSNRIYKTPGAPPVAVGVPQPVIPTTTPVETLIMNHLLVNIPLSSNEKTRIRRASSGDSIAVGATLRLDSPHKEQMLSLSKTPNLPTVSVTLPFPNPRIVIDRAVASRVRSVEVSLLVSEMDYIGRIGRMRDDVVIVVR